MANPRCPRCAALVDAARLMLDAWKVLRSHGTVVRLFGLIGAAVAGAAATATVPSAPRCPECIARGLPRNLRPNQHQPVGRQ